MEDVKEHPKSWFNTRTTLWIMVFLGFGVNFMMRVNINITIVDMIKDRSAVVGILTNGTVPECLVREIIGFNNTLVQENVTVNTLIPNSNFQNRKKRDFYTFERTLLDWLDFTYEKDGFDWNEHTQGLIFASFFWLHWLTQIPGGIWSQRYGAKLVFGLSNFIGCGLCFFMPIASYIDYRGILIVRILQGLSAGVSMSSIHHMAGQWIPPNERSRFGTAFLGSSLGVGFFYPFFGCIMSWMSWEWVYHISGMIGIVWTIAWGFLVYNTPQVHPRIDPIELEYIEKCLGNSVHKSDTPLKIPWKNILTDSAFWMIVIAEWGGVWGIYTMQMQTPTYFNNIHGVNIKTNGIMSGFPYIGRLIFAIAFSAFADFMLRKEKATRTFIRKLAGAVCLVFQGIFIVAFALSGCNTFTAITFLVFATTVHGAVSSGPLANFMDLSPNFAGVLSGTCGLFALLPGFISPLVVAAITFENQSEERWKLVFLLTGGMLIFCGSLYVLFGSAKLRSWNNPKNIVEITESSPVKKIETLPNAATPLNV